MHESTIRTCGWLCLGMMLFHVFVADEWLAGHEFGEPGIEDFTIVS